MNSNVEERVYDSLIGILVEPIPGIEDAFRSGSDCDRKYEEIYALYTRIKQATNQEIVHLDLDRIIDLMLEIQRILCYKMFRYGVMYECLNNNKDDQ